MKGIPAPCIKYYAEQLNINVLDVHTKLFNKLLNFIYLMITLGFYVETIKIIQYQMYQISFGNANTSEMEVISSSLAKVSLRPIPLLRVRVFGI